MRSKHLWTVIRLAAALALIAANWLHGTWYS
jgi:hypothetical protein